jgi:hypothetical protein
MVDLPFNPAPAPGATPRQPYPPAVEAARREGERIGQIYGRFKADVEQGFLKNFEPRPELAGVVLWDRMGPDDRRQLLANYSRKVQALPKLPVAPNRAEAAALREGFLSGSSRAYESRRFEYWAVYVACELAQQLVLIVATGGTGPVVRSIGAAAETKFSDCAAHTASRVILEATGIEVSAPELFRAFGLPRQAISKLADAIAYAKNYFTKLGIVLRPTPVPLERGISLTRYPPGRYVIFMEGIDGHVVYGEIAKDSITIIDDQIGKRWSSITAAQYDLQMRVRVAYLIEQVTPPL